MCVWGGGESLDMMKRMQVLEGEGGVKGRNTTGGRGSLDMN